MKFLEGLDGLRQVTPGGVLSVGNFDGHASGASAIAGVGQVAVRGIGGTIAAVTFEPHPLTVLRPELAPPRLTPPWIKRKLLEEAGVDEYVVLPPSAEVLNLSAEAFWGILRDEVRPTQMIEGSSFSFGKGRGGNIDRLREWAAASAIKLHVLDGVTVALLDLSVVPVSSSLIRWLLAHGRAGTRRYVWPGVHTAWRGCRRISARRQLGVPTANLRCEDQLVPGDGVYVGRCAVDGQAFAAALSIGTLPTFGDQIRRQVECI